MNNWMEKIGDSVKISEINLPGTHNSCTKKVQFGILSKCHDLTISEQLNIGVRFLDVRVQACGKKLKTVHSITDCYKPRTFGQKLFLDDVIEDCKTFLKTNPSETVIICIKRDDGISASETFDILFENYIKNDRFWYTENRIPLLGKVRGKLVFANRCGYNRENKNYNDLNTGINLSDWPDLPRDSEKTLCSVPVKRYDGKEKENLFLQDMYKLPPAEKWLRAILPLLESPPQSEGLLLNFFSAAALPATPRKYTRLIHKNFGKINLKSSVKYGWLIFDFPTEKLCKKVVETNFQT